MFFFKKQDPEKRTLQELADALDSEQKTSAFLLTCVRACFVFLRDFSMELAELDTSGFREELSEISDVFSSDISLGKQERIFERGKGRISEFIARQQSLVKVREKELKDIIAILSRAVAAMDAENDVFNRRVFDQSGRFAELAHLEDIRQLKTQLEANVTQMRQTIEQKREKDKVRIQSLSTRVASLNEALEQARTASQIDALTRVSNRRSFDETLRNLLERNTVENIALALFLLDIDNFKSINDTYGHPVGDRVLLATAQLCKSEIRGEDFIGRYGGEEFVLMLTGMSLGQAKKRGARICERIAAARYRVDDREKPEVISFTISIGITVYQPGDTVKSIVERADQALYLAKRTGKNKVCTDRDFPSS